MDPKPEHRRVYLATKDTFTKERAKTKKLKSIRKAITNTGKDSELQKLVDEFGIKTICQWVQELLCDGIYEFSGQAISRFPELFEPSFSQRQETALLEAEASRKEEIAVQEAVQNSSCDDQDAADEGENKRQEEVNNDNEGEHDLVKGKINAELQTGMDESPVPSLFPIYFPFDAEHLLMKQLQAHLERVSFGFGQRMIPDVLLKEDWDCPESVELNRWVGVLGKQTGLNASGVETPSGDVLQSIVRIRHTAVHRLRTNSKGLERLLHAADDYVKVLGAEPYCEAISQLKSDVALVIAEFRQNKQFLQRQQIETQERIAEQRAELDRLERGAITHMISEDQRYQKIAGDRLKSAILLAERSISTGCCADTAGSSNANGREKSEEEEEDEFYDCVTF